MAPVEGPCGEPACWGAGCEETTGHVLPGMWPARCLFPPRFTLRDCISGGTQTDSRTPAPALPRSCRRLQARSAPGLSTPPRYSRCRPSGTRTCCGRSGDAGHLARACAVAGAVTPASVSQLRVTARSTAAPSFKPAHLHAALPAELLAEGLVAVTAIFLNECASQGLDSEH